MCPRPRPEPRGGGPDREGLPGGPPPPRPAPVPRLLATPGPAPVYAAALGLWSALSPHPGKPTPRRVAGPGFTAPPPSLVPCARQRLPGVARHPSARAPGVLPSPLPSHGPRGLDASAAAARSNAGAGWTGLRGPVSMGRGGRRGPDSGSASPTGAANAGRLSSGVPACS